MLGAVYAGPPAIGPHRKRGRLGERALTCCADSSDNFLRWKTIRVSHQTTVWCANRNTTVLIGHPSDLNNKLGRA
jgi:hypothetical protein